MVCDYCGSFRAAVFALVYPGLIMLLLLCGCVSVLFGC